MNERHLLCIERVNWPNESRVNLWTEYICAAAVVVIQNFLYTYVHSEHIEACDRKVHFTQQTMKINATKKISEWKGTNSEMVVRSSFFFHSCNACSALARTYAPWTCTSFKATATRWHNWSNGNDFVHFHTLCCQIATTSLTHYVCLDF